MVQVVQKRWGSEYTIYLNEQVEIKHLSLKQGNCTSLHCHPKKKTGLLVIKGLVRLDFLNSSQYLEPGDKVCIRQGVFHRSNAILESELLEIENPVDKNDLVRLEDKYGRDQGYETHTIEEEKFVFSDNTLGQTKIIGLNIHHKILYNVLPGKYLILKGGIYNIFNNNKVYVLSPGDLVDYSSILKIQKKFNTEQMEVLHVI